MINKKTILWLIVLGVGITLILITSLGKSSNLDANKKMEDVMLLSPSPLPGTEENPLETNVPVVSDTPKQTPRPESGGDPVLGKLRMAECSLTGSILFTKPNSYRSDNAFLHYKNIDSVARHINWSILPSDDITSIGPNLFASLPIPDGKEGITIGFGNEAKYQDYTLTAAVTYGVLNGGNLDIKETECTGETKIRIDYL